MSDIIYISIIVLLISFCAFLLFKIYRFSVIILNFEEALEDSLDILNEKHMSINKVLEKEVFFDSIEVRQVISDIKQCNESIVYVANRLTNNVRMIGETEKED